MPVGSPAYLYIAASLAGECPALRSGQSRSMALGNWWIFKDRVIRWVPEKEAEESRGATEKAAPSIEERLRRGQEESDRLREGLRRSRDGD
jgi:hypothetical protein